MCPKSICHLGIARVRVGIPKQKSQVQVHPHLQSHACTPEKSHEYVVPWVPTKPSQLLEPECWSITDFKEPGIQLRPFGHRSHRGSEWERLCSSSHTPDQAPLGRLCGCSVHPQRLWTPQLQRTQTAEPTHQERSSAPGGWTAASEKEGSANNF